MKTFDELFDSVIKHEGYYANVPGDRGGETYMGVARELHPNWKGWAVVDAHKKEAGKLKWNTKIDDEELTGFVKEFYKEKFYDHYGISHIENGALQEIVFDWCVNSGNYGSKGVQKVLNDSFGGHLVIDGIIGSKTIEAINSCNAKELFGAIKKARIDFYHRISKKGSNHKFLKGWLNRINSIEYTD